MRRYGKLFLILIMLTIWSGGCATSENAYNESEVMYVSKEPSVEQSNASETSTEDTNKEEPNVEPIAPETDTTEQQPTATDHINSEALSLETKSVELIMVGDILLHTPIHESGKLEDGTYDYNHLFVNVKEEIEGADIAIVNQEVILGGTELGLTGYPSFNGAYEVGDALVSSGFDVILHATNHTLDKGEKGVRNCLSFWKDTYPEIYVAGINESSESQKQDIVIVEEKGIKIAILNYTYGTNGIALPDKAPYIVNLLDETLIKSQVELAKKQADFIIVCPHWGTEYRHEPDNSQKKWVQFFADLGVDLVLGTHPHVIEPVEWVVGEGGKETLVYYSLGNFVNATSGTGDGVADRMLGAMASVKIKRDDSGKVVIDSYDALPIVAHLKSGIGGITVYHLSDYTSELEQENEITAQDSNFSIDYLKDVWGQVVEVEEP